MEGNLRNSKKNIIQHLGTDQFPRLKVGVGGKPHPDYDMADWVMGKFQGEDKKVMDEAVGRAADAVAYLLRDGPQKAKNRFNSPPGLGRRGVTFCPCGK